MIKLYKFSELDNAGQRRAAEDYLKGLNEGRDKNIPDSEQLTVEECYEFCMDTDDEIFYTEQGKESDA